VEGLGVERDSGAIVDALIAMAGALSLGVIAEGVETARQMEELRRLGCRRAQGFYFAPPLPAEEAAYSGRWQTASTLLPSGSKTNAP
jgi:EAL domain-containing protein (putative c-di-GMP-specific phosphodiesterase class I)